MKKYKTIAIFFYIAAIAYYITGFITLTSHENNSMWVTWFCLGSSMIFLASVYLNKYKKGEKQDEDKQQEISQQQDLDS